MAADVETMFYVRETPWHGLGVKVASAPKSQEALRLAGLDWKVIQEPIYTGNEEKIEGFKANVRDLDRKVLGVVTDRYKIIQNEEAFTDELLGEGVRYETAGSLMGGRKVYELKEAPSLLYLTPVQLEVLEKELVRTGVSLETVLERYHVKRLEEMTAEVYAKALNSLKKTKTREAA